MQRSDFAGDVYERELDVLHCGTILVLAASLHSESIAIQCLSASSNVAAGEGKNGFLKEDYQQICYTMN